MNDRPLTRREIRELERLREIAETIAAESVASYVPGSGAGGGLEGTGSIAAAMAPFFEERLGKESSLAPEVPPVSPPPVAPPVAPQSTGPVATTPSGSIPQVTAHTGPFSAPLLPNPVSTGPVTQPPVVSQPVSEPIVQPTFTSPVVTPVLPPSRAAQPPSAPAPAPIPEPAYSEPLPVIPEQLPVISQPIPAALPVVETPQPFASLVQNAQAPVAPASPAAEVPASPAPQASTPPAVKENAKSLPTRRSRAAEARAAEPEAPEKSNEFFRSGPIDIVSDTNSIVIEMPKDITNSTLLIADSGVVLTTGSITLPPIKADTGEISLVAAAEAADAALAGEKREFVVTGIEPLAARRHLRSRKRSSVFPTRLRRGMGQVYLVLFSAIMTATVLGMLIAAYMLGLIHF